MTEKLDVSSLLPIVGAEEKAIVEFTDWLSREQDALKKLRADELMEFAAHKDRLSVELNSLSTKRDAWLITHGQATGREGMDSVCGVSAPSTASAAKTPEHKNLVETWSKILVLAAQARELNRVNGELIHLQLQHNSQALETLKRGQRSLDLYGPDGKSSAFSPRRISDSA